MSRFINISVFAIVLLSLIFWSPSAVFSETVDDFSLLPPFASSGVPPLVMLTMARNHKLYYEAYNDISDLDGDAKIDIGYKGYHVALDGSDHSANAIDYYGYFDSYKCYEYDGSTFNPTSATSNKICSGTDEWSGDFLNYVTMSRMDTLRKVLFGGYRSTDTTTETVLERVFIPQDAHSWGKEYGAYVDSGGNVVTPEYSIEDFTPLALPVFGTRHLIANTSLGNSSPPVMRVMPNSAHRIWEWVAKERPVADTSLEDLSGGGVYTGHPANHIEYEALVLEFATATHLQGSQAVNQINGSGNPFGDDDYYLTVFDGSISISSGSEGNYQFAVDGDDAVEVIVDGIDVAGFYGGHGACGCTSHNGTIYLGVGTHTVEFRHQEATGGDSYSLYWEGAATSGWEIVPAAAFGGTLTQTVYNVDRGTVAASVITDYEVRVKVCDSTFPEDNCKQYSGGLKPTGLFQKHGESDQMYFGLMTGSYAKNTSGGVLRKNVGSITDEINLTTGQFDTTVNGIISTINKLRIVDFDYGSYSYNSNCGWITTRPIVEGECRMWGNPIGEIMYESLRYFAGKSGPTAAFDYSGTTDDSTLGLPKPTWQNPYDATTGYPDCAQPFMLVISDPNSNFDSDNVPGSYFNTVTGDLTGFDAEGLADTISTEETIGGNYFIGQSAAVYDGAPTEKSVTSLGNIRGLSPEEPTKQGSFYPASVAYYGHINDLNAASSDQKVTTFGVALSSPLPRIEVDTDANDTVDITIVPFAKSVGGSSISAAVGAFQPTNTIVDVFMQEQTPTYGRFRINFEDVEQGADHDMDAIATYEYTVNGDGTLTIDVASDYAAGGIIQHMGYVISGTTADGTYLVVRDVDTATTSDPDYFLDTPPGQGPGGGWNDSAALPLSSNRTFTASGTPATILNNPLWFASKWGGFEEKTGTADMPDDITEWDEGPGSPDGEPDTYFYVTNPLYLEQQLGRSFAEILRRSSSGTAASVISSSRSGEGAIYQSLFFTTQTDTNTSSNTVNWTGQTHSLFVDSYGNIREDSNGNGRLDMTAISPDVTDKIILFSETTSGTTVVNKYTDDNGDGELTGSEATSAAADSNVPINDLLFVWNSSDWLNNLSDTDADILSNRGTYISSSGQRYIITYIDTDADAVPDTQGSFVHTDSSITPYIHALPPFDVTLLPESLDTIRVSDVSNYQTVLDAYLTTQRERVVKYTRGQDQPAIDISAAGHTLALPAMRSRAYDYVLGGDVETWRLGDIVHSTPTIVGTPAEDYDLLYYDQSYTDFYLKYKNRRNVVYVGANDGMLHAFNSGFYNRLDRGFYKNYNTSTFAYSNSVSDPDLGAELWAYVPFNLLPHLYWLTEAGYDTEKHVAFMDLKPRIFDAKIFVADATHPSGWGTVMVVGMRFGGGALQADTDGDNTRLITATGADEPVARSAFVVMDITDPELPPTILGELSFDALGYTTAFPTVAIFKDRGDSISPTGDNDWYLVLGSGPFDSASGGARGSALFEATSDQSAKVYMVDLKELAQNGIVGVINSSGITVSGASIAPFASLDNDAFVSDLVSADFDLNYRADAIYFGTVEGDFAAGWGGKLRRLVFADNSTATTWDNDSVLVDLTNVSNDGSGSDGQPIVAAPAIAMSKNMPTNDYWIYFGTGRFFNRIDVNNLFTADDDQAYYGIKEPVNSSGALTWGVVDYGDLLDTTNARIYEDGFTVTGLTIDINGAGSTTDFNFDALVTQMKNRDSISGGDVFSGWRFSLTDVRERNLGQGALLGEILTFSTYMPAMDACEIEGSGNLYAVYFTTGTAYKKSIFGLGINTVNEDRDGDGTTETTKNDILRKQYIGRGMTLTPNLHVGRDTGSKAFIQTSTGGILGFEQKSPGATKSGVISWEIE